MKILIVEDSEIKFMNICRVLDKEHFSYEETPIKTYSDCIKKLRRDTNKYNILILDMALPRFSKESPYMIAGYDILRRMFYENIDIFTIILTGFSSFTVDGEIMEYEELEKNIYDNPKIQDNVKIIYYNNKTKDWEEKLITYIQERIKNENINS
jgi:ActR/RegA family two-component response regulator